MMALSEISEQATAAPSFSRDPKRLGRAVIGVVALLASIGYLVMALRMPLGTMASPGPGTFPTGVGILAIICSLIVIGESVIGKSESGTVSWPKGHELKLCGIFMGSLLGYVLLLPLLGHYVTSSIYVFAFLRFAGRLSWTRSAIVGLIMGAGLTFVFTELLDIALPLGIW